jgi:hypothetical protein
LEFVVWSPWPYFHRSAGMRSLFILGNELRKRGHSVKIAKAYSLNPAFPVPTDDIPFDEFDFWDGESDAVHIYPEGVADNPAQSDKVVRWVLSFRQHLWPSSDLIVTWSSKFMDAPILQVEVVEPFFVDNGSVRTKKLFWVGKGRCPSDWILNSQHTQITYAWPETRQELAKELQQAKELVLFDPMTCLEEEAKRCGCPVRLMVEKIDIEYNPQPQQVDDFIALAKEKWPLSTSGR